MHSWSGSACTSRFRPIIVLLTFVVLASLFVPGSSSAHLPVYTSGGPTPDTAFRIPDANVSYGITGEFKSSSERIQFYSFSVEAGHVLNVELDVPAIPDLVEFAPVILLMGPSLPAPDGFTTSLLVEFNLSLDSGTGATSYLYNGTQNVNAFEPFTQVNLRTRQSIEVVLPSQAVYYLAVAVPHGWTQDATSGFGKYVLAPGTVEKFTVLGYMAIPLTWIKWHSFWGYSLPLFMLPTFLVVIAGTLGTWYCIRERREDILRDRTGTLEIAFYLGVVGAFLMVGSAVNQLAMVFGYTRFSFELIDYIVLMLQTVGLLLGIVALRMMATSTKSRSTASLAFSIALAAIVVLGALLVGAGWIVGPVFFITGDVTGLVLCRLHA